MSARATSLALVIPVLLQLPAQAADDTGQAVDGNKSSAAASAGELKINDSYIDISMPIQKEHPKSKFVLYYDEQHWGVNHLRLPISPNQHGEDKYIMVKVYYATDDDAADGANFGILKPTDAPKSEIYVRVMESQNPPPIQSAAKSAASAAKGVSKLTYSASQVDKNGVMPTDAAGNPLVAKSDIMKLSVESGPHEQKSYKLVADYDNLPIYAAMRITPIEDVGYRDKRFAQLESEYTQDALGLIVPAASGAVVALQATSNLQDGWERAGAVVGGAFLGGIITFAGKYINAKINFNEKKSEVRATCYRYLPSYVIEDKTGSTANKTQGVEYIRSSNDN